LGIQLLWRDMGAKYSTTIIRLEQVWKRIFTYHYFPKP